MKPTILLVLLSTAAFAQVPTIAVGSRVHDGPAAYLLGGTDTFGLAGGVGFWAGELGYRPWNSAVTAQVSRQFQLVERKWFAVSGQVAGALDAKVAGPFELGLGPHAGFS